MGSVCTVPAPLICTFSSSFPATGRWSFFFFGNERPSLAYICGVQVQVAVVCNIFFATLQVVSQQQVKHPGRFLHVRGQHLDQAAALGVHGGQPHHLGVVLAQTFRALDGVFLIADLLEECCLLGFRVGEIGAVFRGDLVQRRLRDIDIALVDEGGGQAVEHGQHQCADLVAVHVGIGTDDDFIEAEIVEVEGGKLLVVLAAQLHAAAHDLDEVHDDVRLEDAGIVGLEAVQDLAADGHDGLIFTVAAGLDGAHSRIALDDIYFGKFIILKLAVGELVTEGILVSSDAGYMLKNDAKLLKNYEPKIMNFVYAIHRNDFIYKAHEHLLKEMAKVLTEGLEYDHEPLQYLLIDGEFHGASVGHFRNGPYDLNDIVCDLPDAECHKNEIVEAIRIVNYGKMPSRFMGKEL